MSAARTSRTNRRPRRIVEGAGGVVINDEGQVLLIRHRNGTWVFPKGHVEPGESKVDTAVREVEEEAGVQAVALDPRQTWQTEYVNPRREGRRITWYLLRSSARQAVLREAIFPDGGFFAPEEALRMLAFDEDKATLKQVLRAARRAGLLGATEASAPTAAPGTGRDAARDTASKAAPVATNGDRS
jgi:diadenosine hexaphosphate hydrolase (ATP-forming)